MAKRTLYSRITRRLRHIADADEVRGLAPRRVAGLDREEASAPLQRYLQAAAALAGAIALVVVVTWFIVHTAT